jgi:hypothetical protein
LIDELDIFSAADYIFEPLISLRLSSLSGADSGTLPYIVILA